MSEKRTSLAPTGALYINASLLVREPIKLVNLMKLINVLKIVEVVAQVKLNDTSETLVKLFNLVGLVNCSVSLCNDSSDDRG